MKTVFVVGAGPAGLFAAQKIARAGYPVVLFNRDIKPGGLAEYGIYPVKEKMKSGLRKQFGKILELPNLSYFGHLPVGKGYALAIEELREFNPAAMVFAVGAQGTKKLGLPGEEAKGIFSAKDFVFHYNQLPLFADRDFSTGKRIAIVGMGNVMVDIARWVLQDDPDRKTEELTVIARRGPLEAKFDEKEFAYIAPHLDRRDFENELQRVKERMAAVGQDVAQVAEQTFPILARPFEAARPPLLRFRFLASPREIIPDASGRIARLVVTENLLVAKNGGTAAKATDQTTTLDIDTMIFAIGDMADPNLGLPYADSGYVTNPKASADEHAPYQVFDPQSGKVMEGTFVAGWARKASDGLVGIARMDGEKGASGVLQYLEGAPDRATATAEEIAKQLQRRGVRTVDKADLEYLAMAEQEQAQALGLPSFKFAEDGAMFKAIEEAKKKGAPVGAKR